MKEFRKKPVSLGMGLLSEPGEFCLHFTCVLEWLSAFHLYIASLLVIFSITAMLQYIYNWHTTTYLFKILNLVIFCVHRVLQQQSLSNFKMFYHCNNRNLFPLEVTPHFIWAAPDINLFSASIDVPILKIPYKRIYICIFLCLTSLIFYNVILKFNSCFAYTNHFLCFYSWI